MHSRQLAGALATPSPVVPMYATAADQAGAILVMIASWTGTDQQRLCFTVLQNQPLSYVSMSCAYGAQTIEI